mmetsp:Transcript_31896/g.68714  ORF Transcript_31896/g.68714 Transcript_31896/m.68714 type:complete len:226 (+) Transcript_31896:1-678(+)
MAPFSRPAKLLCLLAVCQVVRMPQRPSEGAASEPSLCHLSVLEKLQDMKQKALGNTQLVHVMKDKFAASRDALSHTPQVKQAMMIRWEAACHQAGGKEVVLGAAAAGGTGGLCLGALLFSGESSASAQQRLAETLQAAQQRNRTGLIRAKLRRGFRKRLILVSASSAAAAAYLCTLPTAMEGGFGPMAQLSGLARRLGRSGSAFGRTMLEEPPASKSKQKRRWLI